MICAAAEPAAAETLPFTLHTHSPQVELQRSLQRSDLGEEKTSLHVDFKDKAAVFIRQWAKQQYNNKQRKEI